MVTLALPLSIIAISILLVISSIIPILGASIARAMLYLIGHRINIKKLIAVYLIYTTIIILGVNISLVSITLARLFFSNYIEYIILVITIMKVILALIYLAYFTLIIKEIAEVSILKAGILTIFIEFLSYAISSLTGLI